MIRLFKFRQSLSGKFAVYVITFSSFIALIITAGELLYEYKYDLKQINNRMAQVEVAYLDSITENMWILDGERVETLLQGITRLPDFVFAEVRVNGTTYMSKGKPLQGAGIEQVFVLQRQHLGRMQNIGELVVAATYDEAYNRVVRRAMMFLLANGMKTLLVAFFIIAIFYWLIGRHVLNISRYAHQNITTGDIPALALERTEPSTPDELSELVKAFNFQRNSLLEHNRLEANRAESLEALVTERTAEIRESRQKMLEAKEEAESASKAKSEFLSRMSHELRTPLNAILGFGQLLEMDREPLLSKLQAGNVKEIMAAGHHLLALINEVLDLGRIESGKLDLTLARLQILPLVETCVRQVAPLATARGIDMQMNIAGNLAVVADEIRFKQVVLNLLSNAIKYNHEKGKIRINAAPSGLAMIRISVEDSGIGIESSALERIFQPFERLVSAYSGIEGSGIGLALCKKLVNGMHGELGVESEPGKGSTFWFELPA